MTPKQAAGFAKKYLYAFPKVVSGLKCPIHIKFIADKIQSKINLIKNIKSEKYQLLMISMPPRHGKTELISKHCVPWFLGNNPKKRVILTSYSSDLSDTNSDFAKDIFAKWGPVLWGVNPSKSLYNRNAWNTENGGGIISAGITGGIIGFGADLFIIDDYFKNEKEAESSSAREDLWNKWQVVVGTRLHPGCLVIILATRWNDDDLIGRLLTQAKLEGDEFPFEYEYINLPGLIEDEKQEKIDPLNRKVGDALWPWRYSAGRLKNIKRIVGPYWWNALYRGDPVKRGGILFKSQYFRYYTIDRLTNDYLCYLFDRDEPLRIFKNSIRIEAIVDPALEEKKKNDPTGILTWGYSQKHKVWLLLDRFNDRIPHQQAKSIILNFAFKGNAKSILVENEKIGKTIVKQSAGNDKIGNVSIPFKEVKNKGQDKFSRATPMASYIENERVFFPKNAPWLVEYETNLKKFPTGGVGDEDVDCTAYAEEMELKISIAEALAMT